MVWANMMQITKLTAFQNVCIQVPVSHELDGWMVRFILEQSLGLQHSFSSIADSVPEAQASQLREAGRYTDFDALGPG